MANEQMSLDSILSDEKPVPEAPAPTPAPAAPAAPVAEPVPVEEVNEQAKTEKQGKKKAWRDKEQDAQGRVRDPETGQYASKVEPEAKAEPAKTEPAKPAAPVAAPQQEFTEKEKGLLRAAMMERDKRQAAERERDELRGKVPQEAPKTFWDDPEAALKAHEARIRAETTNARLGMAEYNARQKHPDFDEKVAVFAQLLQQTPGMHQQWLASPDPAEFAYNLAKNHQELQVVGGMEEYRAKIERETTARVRAEVEAELKAKADALAKDRAAIPPSLSDARSTGAANRPVWSGPPSLEEILKG